MLSAALERCISDGLAHIQTDLTHHLDRPQRMVIYAELGPPMDRSNPRGEVGWRRRTLLDILAAERVLPIWRAGAQASGHDAEDVTLPQEWVVDARNVLMQPPPSRKQRNWELGYIRGQAEALASGETAGPFSLAACAAQLTLARALNDRGFDPERVDWGITDDQRLLFPDDAASCAAFAVADGAPWDPASDPAKRLTFWEWWLREAVPAAWASVPELDA